MKQRGKCAATYDQANQMAAKIILADVATYGGEDAALVTWARLVVLKHERDRPQSGTLFDLNAA
jgi:hypothetical protein